MEIAQLAVNGLVLGCIIALMAIGLTMTYKILNFANFAHGDLVALGAYLAFLFNVTVGANLILAILLSVIISACLGICLDKAIWKPLRDKRAGKITLIIASVGLAMFLRNLIVLIWGGGTRNYDQPVREGFEFLGAVITMNQIMVIVVAIVLMFLVYFILQRTKMGKAMRALSDNTDLARVSGINVDRVILWTWVIGMSLAAVGGVMYAMVTTIRPEMGWFLLLPMFAAVILGGIGNPYGAMLGGIIIGLAQELSTAVIPTEYKLLVSFVVLIVLLLIKPQGILTRTNE